MDDPNSFEVGFKMRTLKYIIFHKKLYTLQKIDSDGFLTIRPLHQKKELYAQDILNSMEDKNGN